MLGIVAMQAIIIIAIGFLGLLFLKLRHIYLGKFLLTSTIYGMSYNSVYYFKYTHGIFFKKHFQITIEENDEKTYILKEKIYYNMEKDINISVLQKGIIIYTVDLRKVVLQDNFLIKEKNE
jgi:hypothetical protein